MSFLRAVKDFATDADLYWLAEHVTLIVADPRGYPCTLRRMLWRMNKLRVLEQRLRRLGKSIAVPEPKDF